MFKKASLEGEKFTDREKASKFREKGIVLVTPREKDEQEILRELRMSFEREFESQSYPRCLTIDKIFDKTIISQVTKFLSSEYIQNFFSSLESEYKCGDVTLFPYIDLVRNYFSGPQDGEHGWHDDGGGERRYEYCRRRWTDNYLFGKLGIPLQKNGEMGGSIDIAESTLSENPVAPLRQRISRKLQSTYFNICKKSPPLLGDQWLTDLLALPTSPKTVDPNPLQVYAFSSKLFHRGTPISPRRWSGILKKHPSAKIEGYTLPGNINLGPFNKYMIYVHFGNKTGLESYVYDRSRRPGWQKERSTWIEQYKTFEPFKRIYKNSSILFEQVCLESESK
tara:strand:- start:130 stop:1140 length:1011 start_codon:yes stop_codon:yes gene_type:complete